MKTENLKFTDYYKSLINKKTRQSIREAIYEKTGIQPATFFNWLHRGIVPKRYHNLISEIVGIETAVLFPECETTKN